MHTLNIIIFTNIILNNNIGLSPAQMQPKVQFYPDIETKYEHLINHMNDKNKATEELIKILQEICNFQFFYSQSLDKFANSISKLLIGKDPIKDILIILQRIIGSKAEESQKLAKEIKQDLIPHIRTSIDFKAQLQLKDKQNNVKNIRAGMQKKLKMLFVSENNFKKTVTEANSASKSMAISDKLKALQAYRKKQDQFSDTIDSYNSSLDDYMIKYTQVCEQLSELETKRKTQFRDSISKLVIFEINYIKNLEYNYSRYMESLNKMQGKLLIQDRILGGVQPFYSPKEQGGVIQLAKISNKNYIQSILGKKKVNENLLAQQLKITQLRSQQEPGKVTKQVYHNLVQTITPIISFIHKSFHMNLLIQIVNFSKDIYITRGQLKLSLLNSLLCHELFNDETFWQQYEKRLMKKMSREQNVATGDGQALHRNINNVLDRDLNMLRTIQINPYITKVIQSVSDRFKLVTQPKFIQSVHQNFKRTVSQAQDINQPQSIRRISSVAVNHKNFE